MDVERPWSANSKRSRPKEKITATTTEKSRKRANKIVWRRKISKKRA